MDTEKILQEYQENLKQLNQKKMELNYELKAKKEQAEIIKNKLKQLGYDSLKQAEEDFAKQTKVLESKSAALSKLLSTIEGGYVVDSKEEIKEELFKQAAAYEDKKIPVKMEEVKKDTEENVVEDSKEETSDDLAGFLEDLL